MGGARVQLLLKLAARMEVTKTTTSEARRIHVPALRLVVPGDEGDQVMEVLDAFARADVDADPRAVHSEVAQKAGVFQCLLGCPDRKVRVDAGVGPAVRFVNIAPQVKILHLGGELGGKAAG